MLTCEKCEKILTRYLVGSLPPWSRAAVARHLDKCRPCQVIVDGHYRVALLLETLPGDEPPAGLWNRISNEIGRDAPGHEPVPHAPWNWRPGLVVAAAGLTAGVFLGQTLNFDRDRGEPTFATMSSSSPRIATFVQQHSRMSADNPFADQVSLAAYETTAFRDTERMEGIGAVQTVGMVSPP
jgi:hypothetical protein